MNLCYRPFSATDADFDLLAKIDSTAGDGPKTVEELRQSESGWTADQLHQREFIISDGECIGVNLMYRAGKEASGTVTVLFTLLPAYRGKGFDEGILERLTEMARTHGAAEVSTTADDSDRGRTEAIERLGFVFRTSFVISKLNLDRLDFDVVVSKIQQVVKDGIEILSAHDLGLVGIDWYRLRYDWMNRYMADEHPDEPKPEGTYEEQRERAVSSPSWLPQANFAAFARKTCVGITSLGLLEHEHGEAWTGLTYVEGTYRHKGIASALKAASLLAARNAGVRSVGTINEGHIPMLQLNRKLGFEKVRAIVCYRKKLDGAEVSQG